MRPKLPTFRAPAVDWTFLSSAALALMPISQAQPPAAFKLLSVIALFFGGVFFLYALKYYVSMALILIANGSNGSNGNRNGHWNGNGHRNGNGNGYGLQGLGRNSGDKEKLSHKPFISIHLPLYNEPAVVDRLLQSCTSLDYENYEIIVADDSNDETSRTLDERWSGLSRVKISRRKSRSGFKGGALQTALQMTDPRAEFIAVFDADFIPPPDILQQFLSYFYGINGNGNGHSESERPTLIDDRLAVVQGYQWHILNASENWITRGIRTEFAGSYVIERSSQELIGAMKMISGSVFMVRADVMRQHGWGTSITEDWELTLRLYLSGYKVLYTPFIQAPSECVATFKQLARQRMRWAEGHTFNVRKYFHQILSSPNLNLTEKLEFVYYAPYYLQSVFFIIGTGCWLLSELVLRYRLPMLPATLGWTLVFTNALSLVLMNLTGLFMERGLRRNWSGLLSFILLTYLLVPYQAYAALKGLIEPHEGGWHRTEKTGVITDIVDKLGLGKRMRRLLPKQQKKARGFDLGKRLGLPVARLSQRIPAPIRRRAGRLSMGARIASGLAVLLVLLAILASGISVVSAAPDAFYLHNSATTGITPAGEYMNTTLGTGNSVKVFNSAGQNAYWYGDVTYPTGSDNGGIAAGTYTLNMYFKKTVTTGSCSILNLATSASCAISPALTDTTKTFMIFQATSSDNTPASSSVRCYITSTTNITCDRNATTGAVNIAWQAAEFPSGVTVQHLTPVCNADGDADPDTTNVAITPVADMTKTFLLYSHRTSGSTYDWNDPRTVRLTSTSNVEIRQEVLGSCAAGSEGALQVVQYTNASVTRGETGAMTGTSLPVSGLSAVTTGKTMLLYSYRYNGAGADMCNRMVRGEIDSSTSLAFTRGDGAAGCTSNPIPAVAWERIEFTDATTVQQVQPSMAAGIGTAAVGASVDTRRSVVFAGGQHTTGQSIGEGSYAGDDVIGAMVARHTLTSSTNLQVVRDNTNGTARWTSYVVQFPQPAGSVDVVVTASHTAADGSGATTIVQSTTTTIDANTANPLALTIGTGAQQTFTSADPRRLRVQINVAAVTGGGSFTLGYDSAANQSRLETPSITVLDVALLLAVAAIFIPIITALATERRRMATRLISVILAFLMALAVLASQIVPVTAAPDSFYLHNTTLNDGRNMNTTLGAGASTLAFDTTGQVAHWYTDLSYPTGGGDSTLAAGAYTMNLYFGELPRPWWNSNYGYRQRITINAGTAAVPSGYTISVSFNHAALVSAVPSKSLASGNDMRVVYWNGSSWVEIDRVLDPFSSWNAANTRVSFATQAPIAASGSDANYFLYYGNPGALSPPASEASVYSFWDNFDDNNISDWTSFAENRTTPPATACNPGAFATVGVVGGVVQMDPAEDFCSAGIRQNTFTVSNAQGFAIRARARLTDAGGSYDDQLPSLWYVQLDASNYLNQAYTASTVNAGSASDNRIRELQKADPPTANVATGVIDPPVPNTWYDYESFVLPNGNMRWMRGGVQKSPAAGWANDVSYTSGGIAIGAERVLVEYDWVSVRKLVDPEPTTSFGSEATAARVRLLVSVYHTKADGSTPLEIITSATVDVTSATTNPFALAIGSGTAKTFTAADPQKLRARIEVVEAIDERFVLAYDSGPNPTNLETPALTVPDISLLFVALVGFIPAITLILTERRRRRLALRLISITVSILIALGLLSKDVITAVAAPDAFYLHTTVLNGGEMMNITTGASAATKIFNTPGQTADWFTELTYPTGGDDATLAGGAYSFNMYFDALPSGSWWNSSYAYRQPVTASTGASAAPTGYTVSVTFDHAALVTASKSQADGDDARIVYWNGSTWVELDRFLDLDSSWNSATTKLWFKTQSAIGASSSDANYYIYYGNPAAANPPANRANVFFFADGFETNSFSAWGGTTAGAGDFIATYRSLYTGSGIDGSVSISAASNINTDILGSLRSGNPDGIATTVTANPTGTSISVTSTTGFAAGDEILIMNLRGASGDTNDVGMYEFRQVASVPNGTTLNLTGAVQKSYDGGNFANQRVIVQRVPQWTTVTINSGASLTANDWNGTSGGVLVFRATGAVTVNGGGTIQMNSKGFRGAAGVTGSNVDGFAGESYAGTGSQGPANNLGSGGGGDLSTAADICGEGGAGGSYGSTGTAGGYGSSCAPTLPTNSPGATYSHANLNKALLGSGGGSGGNDSDAATGTSGAGGDGGGLIFIYADSITVNGGLTSNGNSGGQSTVDWTDNGTGGGGSGGGVFLSANSVTLAASTTTATGGAGGATQDVTWNGVGGTGGNGRIRIEAASISGTTSPSASTAALPPIHTGTYAAKAFVDNGTQGAAENNFAAQNGFHTTVWVYLPSDYTASHDVSLVQFYSGGLTTQQGSLSIQASTRLPFIWNNVAGQGYFSDTALSLGAWHRMEMRVIRNTDLSCPTTCNGRAELWVDGVRKVNESGRNTGSGTFDHNLVGIFWKTANYEVVYVDDSFDQLWVDPQPTATPGAEQTPPSVNITVSVDHTKADGTIPQPITSATTTITASTADPFAFALGSGVQKTFTQADPQRVRVRVTVNSVNNGGSFTLAYDSGTNPANLNTPAVTVPEAGLIILVLVPLIPLLMSAIWRRRRLAGVLASVLLGVAVVIGLMASQVTPVTAAPDVFYLHPTATTGITPAGEYMNIAAGSLGSTKTFNAVGSTYWYADQTWPTGGDNASIAVGTYTLNMYFSELPRPWWNASYGYRQRITVTAGSAAVPSGYSASLTFNHAGLVSAVPSKSLTSGDDVRVVYWNGASWVELDRSLDELSSWNNASTKIWFRTQAAISASASDANYYLHYGNSAAVSPPANKANIFDLWDDFTAGSDPPTNWTEWSDDSDSTVQTVSSVVSAGVVTIDSGGGLLGGIKHNTYATGNTYGFVARSRSRAVAVVTDDHAPVCWFINDPTGETFCYETRDAAGNRNRYVKKFNSTQLDGTDDNIQLDSTTGPFPVADTYYVYEVQRRTDGTIRAFRDGSQQFPPAGGWSVCTSQETAQTCLSTTSGSFGLGGESAAGQDYAFDWVWARKLVDPEPAASATGEETSATVNIVVTVSHTAADGTGATTIISSSTTTINSSTANPLALSIGSGSAQTFTAADPRRLRVQINVASVSSGERFVLKYDGTCVSSQCSSLDTPVVTVPEYGLAFAVVAVLIPVAVGGAWRRKRFVLRTRAAHEPPAHSHRRKGSQRNPGGPLRGSVARHGRGPCRMLKNRLEPLHPPPCLARSMEALESGEGKVLRKGGAASLPHPSGNPSPSLPLYQSWDGHPARRGGRG